MRERRASPSAAASLIYDRDRAYFGAGTKEQDSIGLIQDTRAIFGRGYAAEPRILVEQRPF